MTDTGDTEPEPEPEPLPEPGAEPVPETEAAVGGPRPVHVFVAVVALLVVAVAGYWLVEQREVSGTAASQSVPQVTTPSADSSVGSSAGSSVGSSVGSTPDSTGGPDAGESGGGTQPVVDEASSLYEAACSEGLSAQVAPAVTDPDLVEVSGIAVDRSGVAWVLNDSGDRPRIYGIGPDGSVRRVEVGGADAFDWEDIAIQRSADTEQLWIADTGGNIEPRTTVQLYRVPVPAEGVDAVAAERFDVAYPDGPHDVEAVMVEPSGHVLLLTKDPGSSTVYRVDPTAPAVTAELLGTFSVGDGEATLVTSADMSADGSTIVLRTYGSVFLVAVDDGQSVMEALADRDSHCRGVPPVELQGEAISFSTGGTGYVTMGEGADPYLTTVTVDR